MTKVLLLLGPVLLLVLLACGGSVSDDLAPFADAESAMGSTSTQGISEGAVAQGEPGAKNIDPAIGSDASKLLSAIAMPAPAPPLGLQLQVSSEGAASIPSLALQTVDRQIISMASLTIEAKNVPEQATQIRVIAESLGGYVEQVSSAGGPDEARATITVRIPQSQFFDALDRIKALGTVQRENVGSEDVTEQFIDLEARLKSFHRQEESLLSLLAKTETVSEILVLERELARVRSDIERYQGQLNFLERRVHLATITVTLVPPMLDLGEPPIAMLTVSVADLDVSVQNVKDLVSSMGGEIDMVSLRNTADMRYRVFRADFSRMLQLIESEGKVTSKEILEGSTPDAGTLPLENPDARFNLLLRPEEPSEPPSASLTLAVSDVVDTVADIKGIVANLSGEVDRATLSLQEGRDSAFVSLRVARGDFQVALNAMEALGNLRSKELRETLAPDMEGEVHPDEPDARIDVSLFEKDESKVWTVVAIAAPIGGVGMAVMLFGLVYFSFRMGRRRGGLA